MRKLFHMKASITKRARRVEAAYAEGRVRLAAQRNCLNNREREMLPPFATRFRRTGELCLCRGFASRRI